jgi:hypothetical protein
MSETSKYSTSQLLQLAANSAIGPEEFERELWGQSKGHKRRGRKYKSGEVRIYRTRVWHESERPKSIADLSYPPKHATPMGRANLEGEPIFYASAGLPASFVECRLEKGQYVICSEWRNTTDMLLQEVGLLAEKNVSNIERIYHEIFTSTDPAMYKFSARIARHLLSGDPISGLIYPSIAAQNSSQNIALKTGFVDAGLRIVNVSLYYLKNATASFQYETEEIDFALPNHDGSLNWKGRRRQWVIRKNGDQLKMVSNGWSWNAYDMAGTLVDPE